MFWCNHWKTRRLPVPAFQFSSNRPSQRTSSDGLDNCFPRSVDIFDSIERVAAINQAIPQLGTFQRRHNTFRSSLGFGLLQNVEAAWHWFFPTHLGLSVELTNRGAAADWAEGWVPFLLQDNSSSPKITKKCRAGSDDMLLSAQTRC